MAFKEAIVLTGGIAMGKSTVSEIFRDYGVKIIDADRVAHQVLEEEKKAIGALFGNIYIQKGAVDRKALGALIFSDNEAKKKLEALLHPLIYQEIERQSALWDRVGQPYLIDIPLFFETKRYPIAKSIVVYAPSEIQRERLMKRNSFSQEEAQQRINAQMSSEQKRALATYIIDNSHDLHALQRECDKIYKIIFNN